MAKKKKESAQCHPFDSQFSSTACFPYNFPRQKNGFYISEWNSSNAVGFREQGMKMAPGRMIKCIPSARPKGYVDSGRDDNFCPVGPESCCPVGWKWKIFCRKAQQHLTGDKARGGRAEMFMEVRGAKNNTRKGGWRQKAMALTQNWDVSWSNEAIESPNFFQNDFSLI